MESSGCLGLFTDGVHHSGGCSRKQNYVASCNSAGQRASLVAQEVCRLGCRATHYADFDLHIRHLSYTLNSSVSISCSTGSAASSRRSSPRSHHRCVTNQRMPGTKKKAPIPTVTSRSDSRHRSRSSPVK